MNFKYEYALWRNISESILHSCTEIESRKFSELHIAGAILVAAALGDKVLDILLADWELQKVGQHLFQIGCGDVVFVSLVEQLEALSGFFLLASLVPL